MALMRMILIGGIKHCGKTTLGSIAAAGLNYDFFDLDELMLEESMGEWGSVREVMRKLGVDGFRKLEAKAVASFIERIIPGLSRNGVVLSLGGGIVENSEAMARLGNRGTRVYLLASSELLYRRISSSGKPAFLSAESPYEDFTELYRRRDILYRDFADLIHEVDESPPKLNARRLLLALEEHYARK